MRYKWNSKRENRKQHLADSEGWSICKAENGRIRLDTVSDAPHPTKLVCHVCQQLLASRNKRAERAEKANNPQWDLFLRTREWKQVRYEVLRESRGRCSACGRSAADGIVLNVDHIKPRRKYPELALTKSNLQVLCNDCNHGKGNWDETDWRKEEKGPPGE